MRKPVMKKSVWSNEQEFEIGKEDVYRAYLDANPRGGGYMDSSMFWKRFNTSLAGYKERKVSTVPQSKNRKKVHS